MKLILIHILLLVASVQSMAQRWEVGIMGGASNYLGDLAPAIVYRESHPAFGVMGRINVSNYFAIKANVLHGKISGSDVNFPWNTYRNLNFESTVSELSFQFEFNFFRYGIGAPQLYKRFTPYVFSGLSVFHFDPKTIYKRNLIALQPLGTEGQFMPGKKNTGYSRINLAIPIGGGIKYDFTDNFIFGFEVGFRSTFTDYLDDVSGFYPDRERMDFAGQQTSAELSDRSRELNSADIPRSNVGDQRGNPNNKDWYIFSVATLCYRFTPVVCGNPGSKSKSKRTRKFIEIGD